MTQKTNRTYPKPLNRKQRLRDISEFVGLALSCLAEKHDDKEIANLTQLSVSTVKRLWMGQYSLAIRFGTVQALAAAAGFRVELTEYGVEIRLV